MKSTVKFLASVTLATLIAGSGAVALASSSATTNNATSKPTIEVRVYDYVHLESNKLQAAENEAGQIFTKAGVNVRWVDCPTSHEVLADFPACSAPPSAVSSTLNILTGPGPTGTRADYQIGETEGAHRATIFFGRIEAMTGGNIAPADIVLGRLIVHLVGRDLLRGHVYAKTGIMQDYWSDEQMNEVAGAGVVFTQGQARSMVNELNKQESAMARTQTPASASGQ